jgi:hypothetical protein
MLEAREVQLDAQYQQRMTSKYDAAEDATEEEGDEEEDEEEDEEQEDEEDEEEEVSCAPCVVLGTECCPLIMQERNE